MDESLRQRALSLVPARKKVIFYNITMGRLDDDRAALEVAVTYVIGRGEVGPAKVMQREFLYDLETASFAAAPLHPGQPKSR